MDAPVIAGIKEKKNMMKVFNSLTRRVEELKPLEGNTIRLYTCGPTVYNFAHIGNFRACVFEDVLRRVIQFNGMKIRQVMNLTAQASS